MIAAHTLAGATTREQILQVARELIQTRSYLGFSFQDVADQVGIRKASLYHHFPTKEALGVEVLRTATQAFKDWTAAKPRTPQAALEAYFRMYRNGLRAGESVPGGCAGARLGLHRRGTAGGRARLARHADPVAQRRARWLGAGRPRCRLRGLCVRGLPGSAAGGAHDRAGRGFRRGHRTIEAVIGGLSSERRSGHVEACLLFRQHKLPIGW